MWNLKNIKSDLHLRLSFWLNKSFCLLFDAKRYIILSSIGCICIFGFYEFILTIIACIPFIIYNKIWVRNVGSILQVTNSKDQTYLSMRPIRINKNDTKSEISRLKDMALDSFEELCNSDLLEKTTNDHLCFTTSSTILKRLMEKVYDMNGLYFNRKDFLVNAKKEGFVLINGEKITFQEKYKLNAVEINNLKWFVSTDKLKQKLKEQQFFTVYLPVSLLKSNSCS